MYRITGGGTATTGRLHITPFRLLVHLMAELPALATFGLLEIFSGLNSFMTIVIIAFIVGVAAPWALWAIWIGPAKGSPRELRAAERESERLLLDLKHRQADNDQLARQLGESRNQADQYAQRVRRVLESEGRIWERPADGQPPRFRTLGPRTPPIISLMNLKGGVGKTTIAANVGATMASLGRRVLLVDLDFQSSLTSLCMSGRAIEALRKQQRFVQLAFADQPIAPGIVNRALAQIGESSAALWAADEDLVNCEQRQMTRWLIGETPDDIRFRLRALLHDNDIQSQCDAIILDCPPRLTTASINALAASDFVLVPTLLDPPSVERVPSLLAWLRRLKDQTPLCSHLHVLGVLANQVQQKNELSPREQETWQRLQDTCADRWGGRVARLATMVPRRDAFPKAAERHEFAAFDRELVDVFQDLVKEIDQGVAAGAGRRHA